MMSSTAIEALEDDAAILRVLSTDRAWAIYALCDVDAPYRRYARFLGSPHAGTSEALVLIYTSPNFTGLQAHGDRRGVHRIFESALMLPAAAWYAAREDDTAGLASRYHLRTVVPMYRMVAPADTLVVPPTSHLPVRRLTGADYATVDALYEHSAETAFDELMLSSGMYVGAWDGDSLVAVAGTHAVSPRRGVAAVGGVFTAPAYRGQGLATAVTGAVCQLLVSGGVDLLGLNVRQDNPAAIAAYTRLGFRVYTAFTEGLAERRE